MSVISSRTGISILKSPLLTKNRSVRQTPARVRFEYPKTTKIKSVIKQFRNRENIKQYEELVCLIRDCDIQDDDLQVILAECRECINLLGQDVRLFVEAVLSLDWPCRCPSVTSNYQLFLLELLTAHNYYAVLAMEKLVQFFLYDDQWVDDKPSDDGLKIFTSVHKVIENILHYLPMTSEILVKALVMFYPYYKKVSTIQLSYLHNLLWILTYRPELRLDILRLIINKLIVLDVHAPKTDIEDSEICSIDEENEDQFQMETDEPIINNGINAPMKHSVANALDKCMMKLFQYIREECFENNELVYKKAEKLYKELIVVFEEIIFPTHAIYHVQFIMFYLCSFKVTFVEAFLNFLWRKVSNPNVPPVLRQVAVCYIASILARARYIPMGMLRAMMNELCGWLHCYIARQDGVTSNASLTDGNSCKGGINAHRVFYSVAQGLFYVIAFRHKDLTTSKKNMIFLQSLNLAKLVTSPLNPLRFCLPTVVQNFAAVTRAEQLAYCYTVIERNERNSMATLYGDQHQLVKSNESLDTFFPFDPYILKSSEKFMEKIYLQYQSSLSQNQFENQAASLPNVDEDDFLHECNASSPVELPSSSNRSNQLGKFSYGTSPGFKQSFSN